MTTKPESIQNAGLQFFGQISASISHEIKNVLAIINENAGLLEDLSLMAERGKPLDPQRLKTMSAAVKKQIGRADGIIQDMNRFAHSIDQNITTVDLAQTIELTAALTARFAAMRGVKVALQLPQKPAALQTVPFFLIYLLWRCLDFAMSASGEKKQVELVAEETQNGARVRFKGLAGLGQEPPADFPSDRERSLLAMLKADLALQAEGGEIVLELSNE